MNWQAMKQLEPALAELEAREAGRDGRGWFETWTTVLYEQLSKVIGPGSGSRFTSYKDFERAHRGLLLAWSSPDDQQPVPPWEDDHETTPMAPAFITHKDPRYNDPLRGGGQKLIPNSGGDRGLASRFSPQKK